MKYIFDTEALIAFAFDEDGSEQVEDYLKQVFSGDAEGYVNIINLTELRYVSVRLGSKAKADTFIHYLQQKGLNIVDAGRVWESAADYKDQYKMSLADAYATASATTIGGTLLVGADDDFDEILTSTDIDIERFRENSV